MTDNSMTEWLFAAQGRQTSSSTTKRTDSGTGTMRVPAELRDKDLSYRVLREKTDDLSEILRKSDFSSGPFGTDGERSMELESGGSWA
jgi:hypothetical protein